MSQRAARMAGGAWSAVTLTDEEVVERVVGGDVALFEVLVRRHQQRVYRAVRAILKQEAEVEDVMQQAYLSAYLHLRQFVGAARFSTWLVRIAVNEAIARLRALGRASNFDQQPDAEPTTPEHAGPERQVGVQELLSHVETAVEGLPDIYRVVLMLREVEGLSTSETAECLDVSEQVVKVRLHRARSVLREDLVARLAASAHEIFQFAAPRCDRAVDRLFDEIAAA